MGEVTDPGILAQLNGTPATGEVIDPEILAQLNGGRTGQFAGFAHRAKAEGGEPQKEPPATLGGTLAAGASGALQGLGQLNWLERYPEHLIRQGLSHLGVQDRLAAATGNNPEGVMTAGFHDPQNTTERIANVTGNVAGSLPIYAATQGLVSPVALGGTIAASEEGAKGGSAGDIATAGGIGAGLNALGYGAGKLLSKGLTPHPASATQQANADTLKAAGIDLTAGQETGSKALRRKELMLGHKIDINPEEGPQQQLGQVGMRSTGAPADELAMDSGNIKNAIDRIGYTFESVGNRNNLVVDKALADANTKIVAGYYGPPGGQPNVLGNLSQDIHNVANYIGSPGRIISGQEYNTLRSQLSAEAHRLYMSGENRTAEAMRDLTNQLDDAFERSVEAGPHSGDAGELRAARKQYQNLLVMQRASTTGTEAAENEMLTPSALKSAAKSIYGERNYATGQGDLTPVSRAANAVLKPMSSSGTAENLEALKNYSLAAIIGGSAGAGSEYAKEKDVGWGWPLLGALAGVAGEKGVTAARAHALYSPLTQWYLKSRLLSPEGASLIKALGAGGAAGATPAAAPAIKPSIEAIVNALGANGTNVP